MVNLTTAMILDDLLGAAILFAALAAAAVIMKLIVSAAEKGRNKRLSAAQSIQEPAAAPASAPNGLKLINVDERTAALIMAIVSHESGIPLYELIFKTMKLV